MNIINLVATAIVVSFICGKMQEYGVPLGLIYLFMGSVLVSVILLGVINARRVARLQTVMVGVQDEIHRCLLANCSRERVIAVLGSRGVPVTARWLSRYIEESDMSGTVYSFGAAGEEALRRLAQALERDRAERPEAYVHFPDRALEVDSTSLTAIAE